MADVAKFNPAEHMIQLKGKDYLQVMWRLVWFREEHPDWNIHTEMIDHDKQTNTAVFVAVIHNTDGVPVQTGYGSESKKDFGDYIEKAETKAVGRALAMLGYGTQFAPDLDEGERIVDSPVDNSSKKKATQRDVQELVNQVSNNLSAERKMISKAQKMNIQTLANEKGVDMSKILGRYKINDIDELTYEQAETCITSLMNTK